MATDPEMLAAPEALLDHVTRLGQATDLAEIEAALERLGSELPPHFASEERPEAAFDAIRSAHPQLGTRIAALVTEHRKFLEEIRALRAKVAACRRERSDLLDWARDLSERLQGHDDAEAELVAEALDDD